MDRLVCLGLSHRTAPVELRERVGALGLGAERCPGVEEHVALTTCYRVELYAYLSGGVDEARDELIGVLAGTHGVERSLLTDHLYVHAGEDVARHLFRVATGLDSLVLGEAEILGQVGDAFEEARDAATRRAGARAALPHGGRGRAARALGDRDRSEPGDGELDGARARRRRAGRPSRAARCWSSAPAASPRRRSRRPEAAASSERPWRTGRRNGPRRRLRVRASSAYGLAELEDALAWADVVVTATSSESPGRERRGRAGRELASWRPPARARRSRCPRRRRAERRSGPRRSALRRRRPARRSRRRDRRRACGRFRASRRSSRKRSERFVRRYRELEVEPLVASIRRQAEEIRRAEVEKALLDLGEVDPETAERIEHLSRALVKKLLHEPTVRLRARAGCRRGGRGERRDTRVVRPFSSPRAVSAPQPAVSVGTRGSAARQSADRARQRSAADGVAGPHLRRSRRS